jgi:hypothetical protein
MAALCQELETLAGRPPVDGRPALDEGRALVLSLDVEFVRVRNALAAEQAINRG